MQSTSTTIFLIQKIRSLVNVYTIIPQEDNGGQFRPLLKLEAGLLYHGRVHMTMLASD